MSSYDITVFVYVASGMCVCDFVLASVKKCLALSNWHSEGGCIAFRYVWNKSRVFSKSSPSHNMFFSLYDMADAILCPLR